MIKQYRRPLSTHFCIYPFKSQHGFYRIQQELVNTKATYYLQTILTNISTF